MESTSYLPYFAQNYKPFEEFEPMTTKEEIKGLKKISLNEITLVILPTIVLLGYTSANLYVCNHIFLTSKFLIMFQ